MGNEKRVQDIVERLRLAHATADALSDELKALVDMPAKEGGSRASYHWRQGRISIYSYDGRSQVDLSENDFIELIAWGRKLFE